jgi:hypothetical protein
MKFHQVISIILGIIVFFVVFFSAITTLDYFLGKNVLTAGFIILPLILIGAGFISTYFTKEKKVRYSLYAGIIIAAVVSSLAVMDHNDIIMVISEFIIYPLTMVIGGFFAKITDKYRKR